MGPNGCWLHLAERFFLAVFGGRLELNFAHSASLNDCDFHDLEVTFRPTSEDDEVTYEVDHGSPFHIYDGKAYRIPLKLTAGQRAGTAQLRAKRVGVGLMSMLWTTNLERIKIRLGDESVVLVRQPSGFFVSAEETAR